MTRPLLYSLCTLIVLLAIGMGATSGAPCAVTVRPGESIQAAVDQAGEGDVICLARGTWTEEVVIDKPVTLRGSGTGRTVLRAASFGEPVLWISAGKGVVIEGMTITGGDGRGIALETPSAGLLVSGDAEVVALDCHLKANAPAGLVVQGRAVVRLEGCHLSENQRYGVVVRGAGELQLVTSTVEANGDGGLWVSGDGSVEIDSTQIVHNKRMGLWIRDEAVVRLHESEVGHNTGPGVRVQDRASVHVDTVRILRNQEPGVTLTDQAYAEVVTASVAENWLGIELKGTASALVERSEIRGNRWDAVRVSDQAAIRVDESVLAEGMSGVLLTRQAQAQIRDSEISGFTVAGISSYGGKLEGEANRMHTNTIDLLGNAPSGFRAPLHAATEDAVEFPSEAFPTLQHAVDALRDDGVLTVIGGAHAASATIDRDIMIVGKPDAQLESTDPNAPVLSLVGHANVWIEMLEFAGGSIGIAAGTDTQTTLHGCVIQESDSGIILWNNASMVMRECVVRECDGDALTVSNKARLEIEASSLERNNGNGITVLHEAHATIDNTIISGNRSDGVIVSYTGRIELVGSTVSGSANGVLLKMGGQGTIRGTTFTQNGTGVFLEGRSVSTLLDNSIHGNTHGIYIKDESMATIEDNRIFNNSRRGITLLHLRFGGRITGARNAVPGPDEPEGNAEAAVHPQGLGFLLSVEGGELDRRP